MDNTDAELMTECDLILTNGSGFGYPAACVAIARALKDRLAQGEAAYDPELLERAISYAAVADEIVINFYKDSKLERIIQRPAAHFTALLRASPTTPSQARDELTLPQPEEK